VTTKVIGSRRTGGNKIPDRFRLETFDDLAGFLGTADQARRHDELLDLAKGGVPQVYSWVIDRPMRALAHRDIFGRLLACVRWLADNADRDLYLRQIDVPGVDTKFIERHRAILSELVDLAIEPVDREARDFAVRVFLVENEVTCLAFPRGARSLLIFGGGYAVSRVAGLQWLRDVPLYYWGDIDSHGFRILDLLRSRLPDVRSLLVDRATLLAHDARWDHEPSPVNVHLEHLTADEAALYRDLVEDAYGPAVRLEQERVSDPLLEATVRDL
jgi:hypothetical protein